jgi:hypothetical protein
MQGITLACKMSPLEAARISLSPPRPHPYTPSPHALHPTRMAHSTPPTPPTLQVQHLPDLCLPASRRLAFLYGLRDSNLR